MLHMICCCALSCSFLLTYYAYCWYTGRRNEALGYLGSIGISLLALSISVVVLNAGSIASLTNVPVYVLDSRTAIDRVQCLVNIVQDRMRFLAGLMLSLTYAELLAMIVGVSTSSGSPISGVSSAFVMARVSTGFGTGMLKSLMYCYSWILLLSVVILELLKICSRLGIEVLAFGSCLLPVPRIRRLGILLIAWGLVLTYALPASINLSKLPREVGGIEIEQKPPENYGVVYTETRNYREKEVPFVMVVLKSLTDNKLYTYQSNRYARKLVLIPLGEYRVLSTCAYWLSFKQNISISITREIDAPIRDHHTRRTTISDGILYYEGYYDKLKLNLPGVFISNSTGIYGWSSIVSGSGRASIISIKTNNSLIYNLYFYINSSRTVFFVGARPEVEVLGYYINGEWSDNPINFTVKYDITRVSIKELSKYYNVSWISTELLYKLYFNYKNWYNRQYWLDERVLKELWKYYPQYPDPRVYIRPPIGEGEFRDYVDYRPPIYKVVISCTQIRNSTVDSKWFASIRIKMPSSRAWIFQPWMFYNPYSRVSRDIWNSENVGLFNELSTASAIAESILRNFVLLLMASDILSGIFGGISISGWIVGIVWDRILKAYAISTTALIVGIGRAVYRSKVYGIFSKILGFKIIAKFEPKFRASKMALKSWKSTTEPGLRRIEAWATVLEESLRNIRRIKLRRNIAKELAATGHVLKYTTSILRESTIPGLIKVVRDTLMLKYSKGGHSKSYYILDKMYTTTKTTPLDIDRKVKEMLHPLFIRQIIRRRFKELDLEEILKILKGSLIEIELVKYLEKELPKYIKTLETQMLLRIKRELVKHRPELKTELEGVRDFYTLSKITSKYDTTLDAITRYVGTILDLYKGVKPSDIGEFHKVIRDLGYIDVLSRSMDRVVSICRAEGIRSPLEVARLLQKYLVQPQLKELEFIGRVLYPVIYRLTMADTEDILKNMKIDPKTLPSSMSKEDFENLTKKLYTLITLEKLRCMLAPIPDAHTKMKSIEETIEFVERIREYVRLGLLDPRAGAEICGKVVVSLRHPEKTRGLVEDIVTIRKRIAENIATTTELETLRKIGIEPPKDTIEECVLFYKDFRVEDLLDTMDKLKLLINDILSIDQSLTRYLPTGMRLLDVRIPSAYDLVAVASELRRCAKSLAVEISSAESEVRRAIIPVINEARNIASKIEEYVVIPLPPFIFGPTVDEVFRRIELSIPRSLILFEGRVTEKYSSDLVKTAILSENREILEELNQRGWLLAYLISTFDERLAAKVMTQLELSKVLDSRLMEELRLRTRELKEGDLEWLWHVILNYDNVHRGHIPLDTIMMIPELRIMLREVVLSD